MAAQVFPRFAISLILAILALAGLLAPAASAATPAPYGTDDAGGFRNVLPPGENGLDNLQQLLAFRGSGAQPPHFADQQPLYEKQL